MRHTSSACLLSIALLAALLYFPRCILSKSISVRSTTACGPTRSDHRSLSPGRQQLTATNVIPSSATAIASATAGRSESTVQLTADAGTVTVGSSSISSSIFNLAKCILGAGILSLPSGVARFSYDTSGLVPSSVLLAIMGMMSAYSFQSIGRTCAIHGVKTISEAWGQAVHEGSKRAVLGLVLFKTCLGCLCYSIIIGDSFSQIFASLGLGPSISNRSNVIVGLTALFIFPLCSLKNMDALKYTSILGLLGTLYTSLFMLLRYLDGSYAPGGRFFAAISPALRPSFGDHTVQHSSYAIFILISMISTAYVAHYNAPRFLTELKDPSMRNYNRVIAAGFGISFAMYMLVMWVGFLTFGQSSTGFILNNYATNDALATIARVAIGAGILCGYPLTFTALRDGFLDLLGVDRPQQRDALSLPVTAGILTLITAVALVVKNVGSVVGFSGALIGATLIFVMPAVMNICNMNSEHSRIAASATPQQGQHQQLSLKRVLEYLLNVLMAISGVAIAVIGVKVNTAKH